MATVSIILADGHEVTIDDTAEHVCFDFRTGQITVKSDRPFKDGPPVLNQIGSLLLSHTAEG